MILFHFIWHALHLDGFYVMQELKRNLNRNIKDLTDFKTVMQAIEAIQSTNISTELQLHGIQETFAILNDHSIEVSG